MNEGEQTRKVFDVALGHPADIAKDIFPDKTEGYIEHRRAIRMLIGILDRRYGRKPFVVTKVKYEESL